MKITAPARAPPTSSGVPVYCKDCNSRDSWERNPEGDWLPRHLNYKCRICGHTTLRMKKEANGNETT